jgi:multicomponent Na+:H+ antiporter subunit C
VTDVVGLLATRGAYVAAAALIAVGLYVLVDDRNLVRKVVGLNVFQTGILLFVVTTAFRADGRAPLLSAGGPYVNPLPHVLVLTAIVVGVSVTAVALALIARLYDTYGTFDEVAIRETRARGRAGVGPAAVDGRPAAPTVGRREGEEAGR